MNFTEHGYVVVNNFLTDFWLNKITEEIDSTQIVCNTSGIRNVDKKLNEVAAYLRSADFARDSKPFLPVSARLVRAILFNKSVNSNWNLGWHQDTIVAVSSQFAADEWRNWSLKDRR